MPLIVTSTGGHDDERDDDIATIRSTQLYAALPNPFRGETTIGFQLRQMSHTVLEVFDVRGRRVREIVNRRLAAGRHTATWDGRDMHGSPAASGERPSSIIGASTAEELPASPSAAGRRRSQLPRSVRTDPGHRHDTPMPSGSRSARRISV